MPSEWSSVFIVVIASRVVSYIERIAWKTQFDYFTIACLNTSMENIYSKRDRERQRDVETEA